MAVVTSVVTVSTSATLLGTGGHSVQDLKTIIVRNDSGSDLYVGGSDVTTANGMRVPTASSITIDLAPNDSLFGICSAATIPIQVLITRSS